MTADDVSIVHEGIVMVCTQEQEEKLQPRFSVVEGALDLPDGQFKTSLVVRLQPGRQPFNPKIRLYVPACCVTDTAWRSTGEGICLSWVCLVEAGSLLRSFSGSSIEARATVSDDFPTLYTFYRDMR